MFVVSLFFYSADGEWLINIRSMVMKFYKIIMLLTVLLLNGCILTKIVTVPMRLTGAVISIVPIAGNTVHDSIDEAAELIDELPL
jgi:hypothetical protein